MFEAVLTALQRVFKQTNLNVYYLQNNEPVRYPYWVMDMILGSLDTETGETLATVTLSGWSRSSDDSGRVRRLMAEADAICDALHDQVITVDTGTLARCYVGIMQIIPDEDPDLSRVSGQIELKIWKGANK